jgi:hypothetical protein
MRLAILMCLASLPAFSATWTGYLVDGKCYAAEERNVNPGDGNAHVDSDMDFEIRYCAPTAKTTEFAVVPADWNAIRLDGAGNAQAAELIRGLGKTRYLRVAVSGDRLRRTLQVTSLMPAPRPVRSRRPRIAHE